MLTVAPPDAAEMRCNIVFESLLWAMSRPGEARALQAPGLEGVIETLIDLECSTYAESENLKARIAATGALLTDDIAEGGYVFLDNLDGFETRLARLDCGSALYPDNGATLFVPAASGRGSRLRLTGPGIDGAREIALDVPTPFWAWRAQLSAYPEGFDLVFIEGASLIAIPRSTQVEML